MHRVRQAHSIDFAVIATTPDMPRLLPGEWYYVGTGADEDVLTRFYDCATMLGARYVVRVCGDSPLVDPAIIDQCVARLRMHGLDYCTNTLSPETFPDGLDVEAFRYDVLADAYREATLPSEREHPTTWIRNHSKLYRFGGLWHQPSLGHVRLCVDTEQDLTVLRAIMADLGPDCDWRQATAWLGEHPEVAAVNQGAARNAAFVAQVEGERNV